MNDHADPEEDHKEKGAMPIPSPSLDSGASKNLDAIDPERGKAANVLVIAAALVVVIAGLRTAGPIIIPFLLSTFIAIIGTPALAWLERLGLPRWLAMVAVIGAIIVAGAMMMGIVGSAIADFGQDLPQYKERINQQSAALGAWLEGRGITSPFISLTDIFRPELAIELTADLFNGLGALLTNAMLIFLTVIFILFEASVFSIKFHTLDNGNGRTLERFTTFSQNVKRYLVIKTATSLLTGAAIWLWLWLLGVDYPVLWGLLAFLLNYVPNIGSIIAAIPALLLCLIQLGPGTTLVAVVGYLIVNIAVGSLLEPRLLGRGLGLSPLVVFLSLVFWGWVLGPVGMFLSVPLTIMIKIALDSRPDTHWIAVLLGSEEDAVQQWQARKGPQGNIET
ncbi:AI-2E family transporter [Thioalkalivibrio sp. HK1]|uniref:AI-2E family transporter n=1 Tax=Thioalkalivibrio sp. HK1 TaxID=1469245 RepID=UPI00046F9082|nr:AI-2E family transporter [Thioalkalivibrio sp. HK1]